MGLVRLCSDEFLFQILIHVPMICIIITHFGYIVLIETMWVLSSFYEIFQRFFSCRLRDFQEICKLREDFKVEKKWKVKVNRNKIHLEAGRQINRIIQKSSEYVKLNYYCINTYYVTCMLNKACCNFKGEMIYFVLQTKNRHLQFGYVIKKKNGRTY